MRVARRLPVMMGLALALLSSLLICCTGCSTKPPQVKASVNQKQFVEKLLNSTVTLLKKDESGRYLPSCAGVWISCSDLLTAKHCVEDSESPYDITDEVVPFRTVRDTQMPRHPILNVHFANVIAVHPTDDIALLHVTTMDRVNHDFVRVSEGVPYAGMTIEIVGHPDGLEYTYMKGLIAATRDHMLVNGDDRSTLQLQAPIWGGNSGGGAFDEDGHLIGIVSFLVVGAPSMGFAVPSQTILRFLSKEGTGIDL